MRHGVLRQKRRVEPDFSADPFTFSVRGIRPVVAATAAAELRTEVRALNLIKLLNLAPGGVADCARNVNLKFQNGHKRFVTNARRAITPQHSCGLRSPMPGRPSPAKT